MSTNANDEQKNAQPKGTLVTGDFIIDQHIYEGGRKYYSDRGPGVIVRPEIGGAGKLADIVKLLFASIQSDKLESARDVVSARIPADDALRVGTLDNPSAPIEHHAYAFWRPQPEGKSRDKQRWKCTEAMGFGAIDPDDRKSVRLPCESWNDASTQLAHPKFVVISEGGMGFRESEKCWQNLVPSDGAHVILKTANDPTTSVLWKSLQKHRENLTVIISASELRKVDARISSGLTWEETFQDFLREIMDDGRLCELRNCKNLIVTFDSEAAVAVRMKEAGRLCDSNVTFVYHASAIEEDLKNGTAGTAFGMLTCFSAAITLALAQEENDLGPALEAGLAAVQDLLKNGHGPATEKPSGFPVERIVNVILNPQVRFTRVSFPFSDVNPVAHRRWSFLELAERSAKSNKEPAFDYAQLTARFGQVALKDLPHFCMGDFFTVDCEEITALRSLRQILRRYDKSKSEKKPLSIGVFGPPGAGKSFAVKEIAKALLDDRSEFLEFNLSQFAGPEDLNGAFHQVRDSVLKGKLPIAFFDEFDSRNYLWLQYLLAPMQDGKFQEGELTHTIGKCIFVFAGGTSWTFDTFGPENPADGTNQDRTLEEAYSQFRLAKGPDFQSRLDGYLNVVGPNPRVRKLTTAEVKDSEKVSGTIKRVGTRSLVEDSTDIWWPIRRALMLRSVLKLKPDKKLEITSNLLMALLRVPSYRHGSRSMEKILVPMQNAGTFRPSFVPHRTQLDLHTDAEEFLRILTTNTSRGASVPKLSTEAKVSIAPKIHDVWSQLKVRNKSKLQEDVFPLTDEIARIEAELLKFSKGKENGGEKDELEAKLTALRTNYDAADRMPKLLSIIGLNIALNESDTENVVDESEIRRMLEFHLELLASDDKLPESGLDIS